MVFPSALQTSWQTPDIKSILQSNPQIDLVFRNLLKQVASAVLAKIKGAMAVQGMK